MINLQNSGPRQSTTAHRLPTALPLCGHAAVGLLAALVSTWSHAVTTYTTTSQPGSTLSTSVTASSTNLGNVNKSSEVNASETHEVWTTYSTTSTPPRQVVTLPEPGKAGLAELVTDDQKMVQTDTRWSDSYGATFTSGEQAVTNGVKYLQVTTNVTIDPTSHFSTGLWIGLSASGSYVPNSTTIPGGITVPTTPASPSFYQLIGGLPVALSSSNSFNPTYATYDTYGNAWITASGSYSFLAVAGAGVALDTFTVSFSNYSYENTAPQPEGAPVRRVLDSTVLPALPVSNVPEPEGALLVLAGLMVVAAWRRPRSSQRMA